MPVRRSIDSLVGITVLEKWICPPYFTKWCRWGEYLVARENIPGPKEVIWQLISRRIGGNVFLFSSQPSAQSSDILGTQRELAYPRHINYELNPPAEISADQMRSDIKHLEHFIKNGYGGRKYVEKIQIQNAIEMWLNEWEMSFRS
jgi:hypothetical protein